jgi:hypothetical protein
MESIKPDDQTLILASETERKIHKENQIFCDTLIHTQKRKSLQLLMREEIRKMRSHCKDEKEFCEKFCYNGIHYCKR